LFGGTQHLRPAASKYLFDAKRQLCISPAYHLGWFALAVPSEFGFVREPILVRAIWCAPDQSAALWAKILALGSDQAGFDQVLHFVRRYVCGGGVAAFEASVSLAGLAYDVGKPLLATYWYQAAMCLAPNRIEPLHNLALAIGASPDATSSNSTKRIWLKRASYIAPQNDRVTVDQLQQQHIDGCALSPSALFGYVRLVVDPVALATLAMIALELKDHEIAEYALYRAFARSPSNFLVFSKRATLRVVSGDLGRAELDLRRSLQLQPSALEPLINLARVLELKGDVNAALSIYEKSLKRRPDLSEPKLNSSILLLGLGRFSEGWNRYQSRWDARSFVSHGRDKLSQKLLTTKPAFHPYRRDRVLVWAEQGLGDEIMFASMYADLLRDAEKVVAQIDPRLITLFRRSFPMIEFHKRIRPVSELLYDSQVAMGDLGTHYRPDVASFKTAVHPYLAADPELTKQFRERLAVKKKVIGISWSTTNPDTGRQRSLELEKLLEVFLGANVELINLQYGANVEAIRAAESKFSIPIRTFEDVDNYLHVDRLASLISCCHLVVTIGNATAHLSAALGVPTWVVTPIAGSWRWMFHGCSTPWYPSVRVFRQKAQNDWQEVLLHLRNEVSHFLET
jgi:tetratricopeptide (TPR) repeat protein